MGCNKENKEETIGEKKHGAKLCSSFSSLLPPFSPSPSSFSPLVGWLGKKEKKKKEEKKRKKKKATDKRGKAWHGG